MLFRTRDEPQSKYEKKINTNTTKPTDEKQNKKIIDIFAAMRLFVGRRKKKLN